MSETSMSERKSELVTKYVNEIWDFLLSEERSTYYVHRDDLIEGASQTIVDLVISRELGLDAGEREVVDHYRNTGMTALYEMRVKSPDLIALAHLEAIYQRHTLTLTPSASEVSLASIAVGGDANGATILVPARHGDFLNLRSAVGTLERAVVDTTDDPRAMTIKVPGLLALNTIADYIETAGEGRKQEFGSYL